MMSIGGHERRFARETELPNIAWKTGGVSDTLARANAYLLAGADGIFVPGVADPDAIATLVDKIAAPVNILAGHGSPPVRRLSALGVSRVSLGSAVAEGAAYATTRRVAEEVVTQGTYDALDNAFNFAAINALMARR